MEGRVHPMAANIILKAFVILKNHEALIWIRHTVWCALTPPPPMLFQALQQPWEIKRFL